MEGRNGFRSSLICQAAYLSFRLCVSSIFFLARSLVAPCRGCCHLLSFVVFSFVLFGCAAQVAVATARRALYDQLMRHGGNDFETHNPTCVSDLTPLVKLPPQFSLARGAPTASLDCVLRTIGAFQCHDRIAHGRVQPPASLSYVLVTAVQKICATALKSTEEGTIKELAKLVAVLMAVDRCRPGGAGGSGSDECPHQFPHVCFHCAFLAIVHVEHCPLLERSIDPPFTNEVRLLPLARTLPRFFFLASFKFSSHPRRTRPTRFGGK